jgi:hypothetical protein
MRKTIKKELQIEDVEHCFSDKVLKVQQLLNKIEFCNIKENGFYNKETIDTIKSFQKVTLFDENGIIDQNLMFRLREILENPYLSEVNESKTFAKLYKNYKESIDEKQVDKLK